MDALHVLIHVGSGGFFILNAFITNILNFISTLFKMITVKASYVPKNGSKQTCTQIKIGFQNEMSNCTPI